MTMQGREDRQQELVNRIVDGAPIQMIVVDGGGLITFTSDACRMFGYEPQELLGTNILDYLDLDWNPLALESIGSALVNDGLRLPMLFRMRCKDGRFRVVEVTANSQVGDPVVQGMAAYIRSWDEQSSIDDILEALAGDYPLQAKLDLFVTMMAGETLDAHGAVLFAPQGGVFTRSVASPSLDKGMGAVPSARDTDPAPSDTPWAKALRSGDAQLVPAEELSDDLRSLADAHGYRWCWAYPVRDGAGDVAACLVLWRSDPRGMEESYLVWIRRLVRLTQLVLEQEAARAQLIHAANHDPLTGLANRAAFFQHFQDVLDDPRDGDYLGVLYLDLDGFKPVNDRLGHGAGDAVLVAIARRLEARVRSVDLVARMGGDEFAVVCPEVSSPEELEILADRLAAAAREPVAIGDHIVHVGASVGVCVAPIGSCSIDALVEAADAALYDAKATNTGSWRVVTLDA
jgi:diguanylate cyclase (GGDEF)-like protein/PAS domain S-box-containing protein